jgi:hypothetical protein
MTTHGAKQERDPAGSFDHQQRIMKMFSDNAKTYIQLSGTALALTLTFARQILHVPDGANIADFWMVLMWSCFLLAVVSGAFYQYVAVKFLESLLPGYAYKGWDWLAPGVVYGIMLAAFYAGSFVFTIYAIVHLRR